ncbi:MAG: hypothetical protein AAB131_09015 [Actinomycetota bacterium]
MSWNTTAAANGSHSVDAVATDTSGNSAAASVAVTGNNAAGGQAVYDAVLGAPRCSTVGNACDSGPGVDGLLDGVALSEPNASNTLGSCTDGTLGSYHVDESIDRIRVYTTSGNPFAAGQSVTIEVTVWAYASFSADTLDLYYTTNANAPTWTSLGSTKPTAAGARTLTATVTLGAGTLQAIRGNFRYNGAAGVCSAGAYDDHDDLVFAVQ